MQRRGEGDKRSFPNRLNYFLLSEFFLVVFLL